MNSSSAVGPLARLMLVSFEGSLGGIGPLQVDPCVKQPHIRPAVGERPDMKPVQARLSCSAAVLSALISAGCATVTAENPDPYENFNRQMFAFNEGLDQAVLDEVMVKIEALLS